MARLLIAAVLALAVATPALAQNFAPRPPPAPPRASSAMATICNTEWGWCPVQTIVAPGGSCYCFVPPATWLPGSARYFPYQGPVSPYLNPHTAPPSTLR
ncbi:MAG TPA: hypothetical protein VFV05_09940 [Methylomirabilota bacterium]|nr:hypothetical protein [Methylomirabilota bacterium]